MRDRGLEVVWATKGYSLTIIWGLVRVRVRVIADLV